MDSFLSQALTLVPPLLCVLIVFLTKRTLLALFCGLLTAATIAAKFDFILAGKLAIQKIAHTAQLSNLFSFKSFVQSDKLFLLSFLLVLSVLIALIVNSGVANLYSSFVSKSLKNKTMAETSVVVLSTALFIDDYLSAMTNSKIGPMVSDQFKVSRLKVSFLITAMAAPLCTLAPVSSWGAAITSFISSSGISENSAGIAKIDSFFALYSAVPFVFFSLMIIAGAIFIIRKNISFGIMKEHDDYAKETGHLFGPLGPTTASVRKNESSCAGSIWLFFMPIQILVFSIFFFLMFLGGHKIFGGSNTLFAAIQEAPAEMCLLLGSCVSVFFSGLIFYCLKMIDAPKIGKVLKEGFFEIKDILIILILAWSMGDFLTSDLKTGEIVAGWLMPFLSLKFLPLSVFLLAFLISLSIGSSWATMTILFPTIIPMVIKFIESGDFSGQNHMMIFLCIGSILSGVVFGSGLAPTADLLLMTSQGTGVDLADYTKAQATYLMPVGLGAALSFLISGFVFNFSYFYVWAFSFIPGLILSFAILSYLSRKANFKPEMNG